jgi:hypothetical protein
MALLLLLGLVAFLPAKPGQVDPLPRWALLPATLVFLAAYFFLFVPWNVRRVLLQSATCNLPVQYVADGRGLHIASARGNASFPWSDFRRWRANANVTLLFLTDAHMFLIPRRLFVCDEDFLAFKDMVETYLGFPR